MKTGIPALGKLTERLRAEALEKKLGAMEKAVSKQVSLREKTARLSTKEVAELLDVHYKTVIRWTRQRKLPFKHNGRSLVFRAGDVLRWQAQQER